jgi:2-oxoglutarate ferredoxin oxidoreductase subunit gamma
VVFNSSLIDLKPERKDVTIIPVPANDIAVELGEVRVANMVALGVILGRTHVVPLDGVMKALAKTLPKHRQNLLPINQQAIERGIAAAAQFGA